MDDPTLALLWAFTWGAIGIIGLRLILRKIRGHVYTLGDYLSIAAIICALVRLALVHVVLIWGTNNMSPGARKAHVFTPEDIRRREIASQFVLANRVFYNSYLWIEKLVLLDTYRRLISNLPWERVTLITYFAIFGATYLTVQIVTFIECKPFYLYWQVIPDPGTCVEAQLQLIVLGVLSIITDIMLIALPIPVIILVKRSLVQKFQLSLLFAVGLFIVAITIVRLPQNAKNATAQVNRTTWASVELFAAAIVANVPVLYATIKGKKKEPRYAHAGSTSRNFSSRERRGKAATQSDHELQDAPTVHRGRTASMLESRLSMSHSYYREIDGESIQNLTTH